MKKLIILSAILVLTACKNDNAKKNDSTSANENQVVNVYTRRHYEADQELFRLFEEKTGIKVQEISTIKVC